MDRYVLKLFLYNKEDPFGIGSIPDLVVDLKSKVEAKEWIDNTVRKATLYDRVTKQLSILISR
jgi:hypothetical protein